MDAHTPFRTKDHDLDLPPWGPYGKRYAGAAHIADKENGLRFDFNVVPALYRRRAEVPSAGWESGYHPWQCSPRFEYFSFRHEIVWKDQVYADVSYSAVEGISGLLVRCELVNATRSPCAAALHFMASLAWPSPWQNSREAIRKVVPVLPQGSILKHSLDYARLTFARREATDGLRADGLLQGEIRGQNFLDGSALGGRFGRHQGDSVSYYFELKDPVPDAHLLILCRSTSPGGGGKWRIEFSTAAGGTLHGIDFLTANEAPATQRIPLGDLDSGSYSLSLNALAGGSEAEIVFLALVPERGISGEIPLQKIEPGWVPARWQGPNGNSLILKYADVSAFHGLAWEGGDFEIREIFNSELDVFLRAKTHDHVNEVLRGDSEGHFTNVFLRPLSLPPDSRRVVWALVCEGSRTEVERGLAAFANGTIDKEAAHAEAKGKAFTFQPDEAGADLTFGQNLMATTTLTNIVFPIYTQRQYIRHRTPGRLWDSLYTWDSGFIGLGLLEIDPAQAEENLAQYLTEPGNPHAAFIHHGSMVPMQIHLYHEIWNQTGSLDFLARHYDAVRQYYLFFAGHTPGSTMRNLKSSLLRSWDYFYNSGGWDDYPPQKHVHAGGLADRVTTASVTAHAIRAAKSLATFADMLDRTGDVEGYRNDVSNFSAALQNLAWDPDAGYFSYVIHSVKGEPEGILRHGSGANFNLGLDGAYPLVAGICDDAQERLLLERLFDSGRLWTDMGLTAVDQNAPYYHKDGYWVGTVWIAHQWCFWKTALDLGRPDLALRIAQAVLEAWRIETGESYNCFEHFLIESGRGCGWHHFSGLSTPVMSFFASCYCPGKLTVGFEVLPLEYRFADSNTSFRGRLQPSFKANSRRSILLGLKSDYVYGARWEDEPVPVEMLSPGLLAVFLPATGTAGTLEIGVQRREQRSTP